MADIKYTLQSDRRTRSPHAEAEANWMAEQGALFYRVHAKPQRAGPGDFVYFIRVGELVARARIAGVKRLPDGEQLRSYTGAPMVAEGWHLVCQELAPAKRRLPHKGFQSFRYVSADERRQFEDLFD